MLGVCDRVVHCAISERRLLSQRFASVVTAHQHHSHVTPLMAQFWLGVGGAAAAGAGYWQRQAGFRG